MKKKKELAENAGPLYWEELPAGEQVEEEGSAVPTDNFVRPDVLYYTAMTVMSGFPFHTHQLWPEKRVIAQMGTLIEKVTSAVTVVCPGQTVTEEAVRAAILQAAAAKNGEEEFADTVRWKWTGHGLDLAFSVALTLSHLRERLPDVYQDNPVIGWSIRNDGCTFIFRDGQKKIIEL